jgi:transcriptional regulator with XRE-family HTH domain
MNIKDIGLIVRTKRLALGLRMDDVARKANISRVTLSMIENGCCNYSFVNLLRVFDCLGLSLSISNLEEKTSPRERAPKILTKQEKQINRFIVMCIEDYAKEKSISGQQVYEMMEENNLFQEITDDYEDLHGMSSSYLNYYIEKMLTEEQR